MQLARENGHSDVTTVSQVDRPFVAIEKHEEVERVITADVERPGGVISVPWLPSECQSLEQLVLDDRLNGNDVTDWAMISSHFPNRSAADCQRMFEWRRTIPSPTANFDVWLAATPATPVGGIAQPTGPSHLLGGTLPLVGPSHVRDSRLTIA